MRRIFYLLGLMAIWSSVAFGASEVAKYEFSSALTSTDTDLTSVAGLFGNVGLGGSTFNLTNGNPLPSLQDTGVDITNGTPPTPAPNNATTDYYTFTITPAPGATLDYSTLSFDVANLTSASTNNSFTISLQTSLNSFVNLDSVTVTGNTSVQNVQWDLSALLASSAPAEFRLAIRDDTASTTNGILLDNVSLTANIALVPEPATSMLMGLGLLIGVQRLRRRKA